MMKSLLVLTQIKGKMMQEFYDYIHSYMKLVFYSASFNDVQNTNVVNRLIKEVGSSNPSFQAGLVRCKNIVYCPHELPALCPCDN